MSWEKVKLGEICTVEKGAIGIQKAIPGEYPLVVTGEDRKSHNEYQFDCEAVIIPLVSGTGHGHASIKRIHFQTGKFALGNILCAIIPKDTKQLNTEYLFRFLDLNKENELVARMKGMANVTLPIKEIAQIEIPLPSIKEQLEFVEMYKHLETKSSFLSTELTHQLTLVKKLRQQLLQDAVQGKLLAKAHFDNQFICPPDESGGDLKHQLPLASANEQNQLPLASANESNPLSLASANEPNQLPLASANEPNQLPLASANEANQLPLASANESNQLPLASANEPNQLPLASANEPNQLPLASANEPNQLPLASASGQIETGQELLAKIKAEKARLISEKKLKKEKELPPIKPEEIPFEIPENWVWCRLGELAYITSGSTPSQTAFVESGIPYLKMYNLRNQKIDFFHKPQYIKEEVHNGQLKRCRAYSGDIIMNIVGPPLGKIAIIPDDLPECNFNQAAVLIRPLKKEMNHFIFWYLNELSEIRVIETKGVAGQDNISVTQAHNMRVPLPPLSEQNRIVQKLDELMQYCNDLEASIKDSQAQNEKLLQQVLREALRPSELVEVVEAVEV